MSRKLICLLYNNNYVKSNRIQITKGNYYTLNEYINHSKNKMILCNKTIESDILKWIESFSVTEFKSIIGTF